MTTAESKGHNRFFKLKIKIKSIGADIEFLKKCLKIGVTPKFIHITESLNNNRSKSAVEVAKQHWLKKEIQHHFAKKDEANAELYGLHLSLTKGLTDKEHKCWLAFLSGIDVVITQKIRRKRSRLLGKFSRLRETSPKKPDYKGTHTQIDNFVYNVAEADLTVAEMELLNKGLNYVHPPTKPPIDDIIVGVESALKLVPYEERTSIRARCKKLLERGGNSKQRPAPADIPNLKKQGCLALKADKGNAVVILKEEAYEDSMKLMLQEGPYNQIPKQPLNRMVQKVKETLADIKNKHGVNLKYLQHSNPKIPSIYGLPKMHKPGNKLRPITSNINAPTERLSKWLTSKLKDLPNPPGLFVKNTQEFVEKVKNIQLAPDEILVSFDVTALYPSVPIPAALKQLDTWLKSLKLEKPLAAVYTKIAKLCMEQTQFQFRGAYYEQTFGTAMGNALSPFIANLFMGHMENKLKRRKLFPRVWVRYVDDIFAVVHKDRVLDLLDLLNSQHDSINFTYEVEKDGKLPFLDVEVRRDEAAGLLFKIYRKPTNTQRFIINESHHTVQHKMAAFNSMLHRAMSIPMTDEDRKAELNYILETASLNGYARESIEKLAAKHRNRQRFRQITTLQPLEKDAQKFASIPYFPTITNKLATIFAKHGVRLAHTNEGKLKNQLGSPKDPTPTLEKSGIYELTCKTCGAVYIGQTRRTVIKRYKEHLTCIRKNPERSSVATHIVDNMEKNKPDHVIPPENVRLLKEVRQRGKLDVYESLYIHKHKNKGTTLMNADDGNVESCLFSLV
jgi:PHD/YefM family antitoxin component YafN of YafNO toxin-antitoxin module